MTVGVNGNYKPNKTTILIVGGNENEQRKQTKKRI